MMIVMLRYEISVFSIRDIITTSHDAQICHQTRNLSVSPLPFRFLRLLREKRLRLIFSCILHHDDHLDWMDEQKANETTGHQKNQTVLELMYVKPFSTTLDTVVLHLSDFLLALSLLV